MKRRLAIMIIMIVILISGCVEKEEYIEEDCIENITTTPVAATATPDSTQTTYSVYELFPDKGLQEEVINSLGKYEGITEEELKTITYLYSIGEEIMDISGVGYLTEISDIAISDVSIDMSPLLENYKLNEISLYLDYFYTNTPKEKDFENAINILSQIDTIETIEIAGNYFNNCSVLYDFENLKAVEIVNYERGWEEPIDVTGLKELHKLESLSLISNLYSSKFIGLEELQQLKSLEIIDCNIVSLDNVSSLKDLEHLNIGRNPELNSDDYQNLANLTNLKSLLLGNLAEVSGYVDARFLNNMENLEILYFEAGTIGHSEVISNLKNLEELHYIQKETNDLGFLRNLHRLKLLYINDSQITDINELSNLGLGNLEYLDIKRNKISNIEVLLELPNLKKVDITGNPIVNGEEIISQLESQGVEVIR